MKVKIEDLEPINQEKYKKILLELEDLSLYLDTPEGKTREGSLEGVRLFLALKKEQNDIVPIGFKERQKIKFIKTTMNGVEDLELLKLKSVTKYEEVKLKMQKKFKRILVLHGKRK